MFNETVVDAYIVAAFCLVTLLNLVLLQMNPDWAVSWGSLWQGLSPLASGERRHDADYYGLGDFRNHWSRGPGEIIFLSCAGAWKRIRSFYWPRGFRCLERTGKGMAAGDARWDAWLSLAVYTTSTVDGILGYGDIAPIHLNPQGMEMIRTGGWQMSLLSSWSMGCF